MDAFNALASTATSSFASTTGYSFTDFTIFGKTLLNVYMLGITQFLLYNDKKIVAAIGLFFFIAVPLALLAKFGNRPARR